MIDLVRIVEYQAALSSYRATQDEEKAVQLELLIEITKPKNLFLQWHPLIATPFRYSPPHPEARFRPKFGKNVFYGAYLEETALYEHAYHFIKQRRHLSLNTETGMRTLFCVAADNSKVFDMTKHPDCALIRDKNDYTYSHHFVSANPDAQFIIYPSCRDPNQKINAAVLDINYLSQNLQYQAAIKFFYDGKLQRITWLDHNLHIDWLQVA